AEVPLATRRRPRAALGVAVAILYVFLCASAFVPSRILARGAPPLTILSFRFLLAAGPLFVGGGATVLPVARGIPTWHPARGPGKPDLAPALRPGRGQQCTLPGAQLRGLAAHVGRHGVDHRQHESAHPGAGGSVALARASDAAEGHRAPPGLRGRGAGD